MPMARRIRPVIAAALLLIPALGIAAERTGKFMAGTREVVVLLPDGYIQSSVDAPDWLEVLRTAAPREEPIPVEAVVAAECMVDGDAFNPYCRTGYELKIHQDQPFTEATWPVARQVAIEALSADTERVLRAAMERKQARNREIGQNLNVPVDATSQVILLPSDDLRSVRFRLSQPVVMTEDGGKVKQWRFGGLVFLDGQLFNVAVARAFPMDGDDAAVVAEMEGEFDAFLQALYRLNPSERAP